MIGWPVALTIGASVMVGDRFVWVASDGAEGVATGVVVHVGAGCWLGGALTVGATTGFVAFGVVKLL